jgi:MFS transporter, ACS family, tartrate transporter
MTIYSTRAYDRAWRRNRMATETLATTGFMQPAAELHTRQLIGIRLLPFIFLLYITNYLDRVSVAFAALGMTRDLHFSDRVFGLGFGIFFIGYVSLQIPGAILVERWSARKIICITMVAWGSLTGLTALVHTPIQLYLARFLLGAAEAAFFPGVVVYFSHWFVREDRAKATSNFMSAIPLSLAIGSPLAGLILGHAWLGIAGWRWLFVLEGLPAVVLGAIAYSYLTDRPRSATWLNAEQKNWIEAKLDAQKPAGEKATLGQAFRSRTVLLLAAVTFLNYAVFYSFTFWMPTMLKRQSGLPDAKVGLLGMIPNLICFFVMQFNGWHSDRNCERRWHVVIPIAIALAGICGLLLHPGQLSWTMFLLTLIAVGSSYLPVFWSVPTEILSPSVAAGSVGLISAIGSLAGFASPYAFGYLNQRTGSYSTGLASLSVLAVLAIATMFFIPHRPTGRSAQSAP